MKNHGLKAPLIVSLDEKGRLTYFTFDDGPEIVDNKTVPATWPAPITNIRRIMG